MTVQEYGPVPEDVHAAIKRYFFAIAGDIGFDAASLIELHIVAEVDIVPTVSEVLESYGVDSEYSNPNPFACAIPIETDEFKGSVIVVGKSVMAHALQQDPKYTSLIVEELYHAKLYSDLWAAGKSILPGQVCEDVAIFLWPFAFNVYQEYVVNRQVLEHVVPIQALPDDMKLLIDACTSEIRDVRSSVVEGELSVANAWGKIQKILHRDLLDPLARMSAKHDSRESNAENHDKKIEAWSKGQWGRYWAKIWSIMRGSYDDPLSAYPRSVCDIADLIGESLSILGVDLREDEKGGFYVEFRR